MTDDQPTVRASAAWSDDPDALAREADASASWRSEYAAQACPAPDADRVPVDDLDRLLALLERVEWRRVPGVSVATVAMLATLLRDAREAATGRREAGGRA